jgi:hypothetical protein
VGTTTQKRIGVVKVKQLHLSVWFVSFRLPAALISGDRTPVTIGWVDSRSCFWRELKRGRPAHMLYGFKRLFKRWPWRTEESQWKAAAATRISRRIWTLFFCHDGSERLITKPLDETWVSHVYAHRALGSKKPPRRSRFCPVALDSDDWCTTLWKLWLRNHKRNSKHLHWMLTDIHF